MAKKYSTTFANAGTEDPISESGVWAARVNTLLTDMKIVTGQAIGKSQGAGAFDDSAALLSGYAADHEITATVFKDPGINSGAGHEIELLMRAAQTSNLSTQYECLFNFNGNIQCFRWFNNGGSQDFELQTTLLGDESIGGEFSTGDRIRARICGSFIQMFAIVGGTEELLGLYNNTVLTSGQPGIGAFFRVGDGADPNDYCFNDAQISDSFIDSDQATDDCARSNETPLSKSGAWSTSTGVAQLDLISNKIQNHTADTDSGMRYTGVTTIPDQYAEITIGTVGGGDFGASVSMQSDGRMLLTTNYNAASIFIFERQADGTFNQLANPAGVYANGDVIRLERFGTTLKVYQNGTLLDTVTAYTSMPGGTFGIFGFAGDYRISSFTGGKLVADYDAVPGSGGTVTSSTLTDTTTFTDGSINSAIRGPFKGDTTVVTDNGPFSAIRGATTTDNTAILDETLRRMNLTRLLEDPLVVIDELQPNLFLTRVLQDLYLNTDGFLNSLERVKFNGDVLTISESTPFDLLRNVTASDSVPIGDELRWFLLLTRLLEDTNLFIDGVILSLSSPRIVSLIADSLTQVSDQGFLYLLKTLTADDLLAFAESSMLALERNRLLEDPIDLGDSQFNFRTLARSLMSTPLITDDYLSQFIDNRPRLSDGSAIRTGFQRQNIVLSSNNLVRIG